ncbi:MAG TPA: 30S ribosomal protein S16 [Candidatus Paceibacterota bacterium]|nr:30S ribosomal protein S16 [Candidatus Paceibacterota bacterium]
MLTIRLQRVGRKNDPSFRVVVTDSKNGPQSGKFLEIVGAYDARKGKGQTVLKGDRIQHWISKGATVSNTVNNILVSKKIIQGEKQGVRIPAKPEEAKVEPAPTPEIEAPAKEAPAEVPAETPAEEPAPEPAA